MVQVERSREMKDRREPATAGSGAPSFRAGWVFAGSAQYPTQVEQLGAIQVQRRYGRSAYSSTPLNDDAVFAPRKVSLPTLTAWVEERDNAPCL